VKTASADRGGDDLQPRTGVTGTAGSRWPAEAPHAVTRTDTALRPCFAHRRFRVVTHGIADLRRRTWGGGITISQLDYSRLSEPSHGNVVGAVLPTSALARLRNRVPAAPTAATTIGDPQTPAESISPR
jgi:hypothetical protein